MSARKVNLAWGDSTCSTEGCSDSAGGWVSMSGRCPFHDAVAKARDLSPEAFDRLRETLATTPPITDEERRARRVRSALSRIDWTARDLKRAKRDAAKAGATEGQIVEAVRSGKAKA